MQTIIIYLKDNCPLCDEARAILDLLRLDYSFDIEERNIETRDEWLERYQLQIPVIMVNGFTLNVNQISYEALERILSEIERK